MLNKSDSKFFAGVFIGAIMGAVYALFNGPRIALRKQNKLGVIGILPSDSVESSIEEGKQIAKERLTRLK